MSRTCGWCGEESRGPWTMIEVRHVPVGDVARSKADAAPDLYAALQNLWDWDQIEAAHKIAPNHQRARDAAVAALAKARGE